MSKAHQEDCSREQTETFIVISNFQKYSLCIVGGYTQIRDRDMIASFYPRYLVYKLVLSCFGSEKSCFH